MDKLKIILSDTKKYQFWILCGVVLVVSLVCWWLATGDMDAQFKRRKSAIDASFSSISIPGQPPNQTKVDEVRKLTESLKQGGQGVYPAWETLYRQQQENNRVPDKLGAPFKKAFDELKPGEELADQYRGIYQNFIHTYIPSLRKIIKAFPRVQPDDGTQGPASAGGGKKSRSSGSSGLAADDRGEGEPKGIVDWDDSDYQKWEDRFQWELVPTTTAVVLAQEDLWVCEAVLRAIARTNQGATSQANAAVKRIEAIEIADPAAEAAKVPGRIIGLTVEGPTTAVPRERKPRSMEAIPLEEQVRRQLFPDRYVDDKGTPLAYEASLPPLYVKHPYAEFKIMPLHLKLVMDPMRISSLLVECANSRMPIEARRVRVVGDIPDAAGPAQGAAPAGPSVGVVATKVEEEAQRIEVPVEIHAVIYIFNPPDREKLGKGAATGSPIPAGSPGNGRR
ncbi:MAG: hypothetical protein ABFC63_02005 [Thermoguttaceae bacterium]